MNQIATFLLRIDYTTIDPGVRRLVRWLNEQGYETTDSGDGVSKPDMECALDVPHVFMKAPREALLDEADRLSCLLDDMGIAIGRTESGGVGVEASYAPSVRGQRSGPPIIMLFGMTDADLPAGIGEAS